MTAVGVGISSAYAVNISLEGDSTVNGNLDVSGDITGPTINAITTAISDAAICPQENIQHWDKIIFRPILNPGDLEFLSPPGQVELIEDMEFDIKVLDDPNWIADIRAKVLQKLNAIGYEKNLLGEAVDISVLNIEIIDVDYAITCVEQPPV